VVIFTAPVSPSIDEADLITGFNRKTGVVVLNQDIFKQEEVRFKSAKNNKALNKQLDRKSNLVYNQKSGELVYDANGRRDGLGKNGGTIAVFDESPRLRDKNFILLAPDVLG
jgi:hypothetical protein